MLTWKFVTPSGAIHPIIHLGFAVEYEQPAIVAEALAMTAIHSHEAARGLLHIERLAQQIPTAPSSRKLCDLFRAMHEDSSVRDADCWKGGTFERNGDFWAVLPQGLIHIAASYKVEPRTTESVDRAMAEMINRVGVVGSCTPAQV